MRAPERIDIAGGTVVEVQWGDGSRQQLEAADVRAACPCAGCRGAFPVPDPGAVRIQSARLVGEYAIAFAFEPDGHSAGIYPFDLVATIGVAS